MEAFEELAKKQKETGNCFEAIFLNYKIDSTTRKQSVNYFQERLRRLDEEWSKFETTDNEIRLIENAPFDHDYFSKEYYNTIMELVIKYREHFEELMLKVTTPIRDMPATVQQQIPKNHISQTTEPSEFTKLARRHGAMLASLERLLADNFSHCDIPIAQKLWENIESIHILIYEISDSPAEQGYDLERYISKHRAKHS